MLPLDNVFLRFSEHAAGVLGARPHVTFLSTAQWTTRLAQILVGAGLPFRDLEEPQPIVTERHIRAEKVEPFGWCGTIALWPNDDPVVFRRIRYVDAYHETVVVMAAARSLERLDAGIATCHAAWRTARRASEPVRTSDDDALSVPPVAWTDLCLPDSLLDDVRRSVDGFAASRALYERLRIAYRRGMLLYGPPGNGKSLLCRAVVTELGWPTIIFTSSGPELALELKQAFALAADVAPSVLIFEDVDTLFASGAQLSLFLNQLDGFETREGILVIATTNHPEKLDSALTSRPSRFDLLFELADPARTERDRYLERLFGDALSEEARGQIVDATDGMSMAFLKEIFVSACTRAITRGVSVPTIADASASVEQLSQHRRVVKREFSTAKETGFGRR